MDLFGFPKVPASQPDTPNISVLEVQRAEDLVRVNDLLADGHMLVSYDRFKTSASTQKNIITSGKPILGSRDMRNGLRTAQMAKMRNSENGATFK